ncbi:replication initiator protein [Sigmofec virus UA08Rod_5712]|uniref:Replication initiator protein n=1 Tax=Sigmofec virus UA08Rod_5712 TaxID=2929438 RepID=A0A976N0Z6_9VIRU|nr:replication initiator protein [Sigmofec virus UA08Rod_5712]
MACTHPLKAWKIGLTPNGKADLKITDYSVDHLEKLPRQQFHFARTPIVDYPGSKVYREFVQIPCNQCTACRIEYSRQWANRCMLELEYHDSAYFVTLTYNEGRVPVSYYSDENGEAFSSLTLCKRDLQLFMKRLRKAFPDDKIRFFAAGEYGTTTFRPHYHLIIFGLHLDDLVPYKQVRGYMYYNSKSLQDCWSINIGSNRVPLYDPIGFVVLAPVTWETCAYTARYVMKKLKGPSAQFYSDFSLEPPFTLMSRDPGIAAQWYMDHPDFSGYDFIHVSTATGGRKFVPPKYLFYKLSLDDSDKYDKIKEQRRQMAERAQQLKLSKTDLPFLEYLKVEEHNLEDRVKKLIRSDF